MLNAFIPWFEVHPLPYYAKRAFLTYGGAGLRVPEALRA